MNEFFSNATNTRIFLSCFHPMTAMDLAMYFQKEYRWVMRYHYTSTPSETTWIEATKYKSIGMYMYLARYNIPIPKSSIFQAIIKYKFIKGLLFLTELNLKSESDASTFKRLCPAIPKISLNDLFIQDKHIFVRESMLRYIFTKMTLKSFKSCITHAEYIIKSLITTKRRNLLNELVPFLFRVSSRSTILLAIKQDNYSLVKYLWKHRIREKVTMNTDLIYESIKYSFRCFVFFHKKEKPHLYSFLSFAMESDKSEIVKYIVDNYNLTIPFSSFDKVCLKRFEKTIFVCIEKVDFSEKQWNSIMKRIIDWGNIELFRYIYQKVKDSFKFCEKKNLAKAARSGSKEMFQLIYFLGNHNQNIIDKETVLGLIDSKMNTVFQNLFHIGRIIYHPDFIKKATISGNYQCIHLLLKEANVSERIVKQCLRDVFCNQPTEDKLECRNLLSNYLKSKNQYIT